MGTTLGRPGWLRQTAALAGLVSPSMAARTLKVMVYGAPFTRATEKQGLHSEK
ncbi:hypothetical protein LMG28727_07602 [Paraburkholderia kirstenboschensis]|nr:hypothetical protein LMG28727_07602 [Paraburkholderia kirstenboschensis]